MFTRQHYKAIAGMIKKHSESNNSIWLHKIGLITDLTEMFKKDNPRFSTDKFIDACYEEKPIN